MREERRAVAVVIPCLDEELGVAAVVADFRRELPEARILVIDNGSRDRTVERARAAGAEVVAEPRRGKGRAIATAFGLLDEDIVIMVDGDGSYPAEGARILLESYRRDPVDMITGIRTTDRPETTHRPLHLLGGSAFSLAFRLVFHHDPADLFSGLRLFSKRFYKNVPVLFRGFELETELTVQAVAKGFRHAEVPIPFRERAEGSFSKLRTVRDGARILRLMVVLARDYRPLLFFGTIAALFFLAGLAAGSLPIYDYLQTRMVGRFPLAILAASLMNLSLFTFLTGIMLESGLRHRRESYEVALRNFRSDPTPQPDLELVAGRRDAGRS
jgi:glycosyltransferase involved in cell wall biosynthesis